MVLLWQDRGLSDGQLGALPYGLYCVVDVCGVWMLMRGSWERRLLAKVVRLWKEGMFILVLSFVSRCFCLDLEMRGR